MTEHDDEVIEWYCAHCGDETDEKNNVAQFLLGDAVFCSESCADAWLEERGME